MSKRKAGSFYRGIKVTLTQAPGDRPCVVTVATKRADRPWDEWDLLFPAVRVPVPDSGIRGYTDILRLLVSAVEELIAADQRYL